MEIDLKRGLVMLPLLMCSAASFATEPVLLGAQEMDRITAGAQPVLERLVNMFKAMQGFRADPGLLEWPALAGDQQWITQLALNEPVTFHRTESGELVATGDQFVIVKQLNPADAGPLSQLKPGDTVTTQLLQPGETLRIQQTGSNGTNYLYVQGTGNSTITMSQHHL